MTTCCQEVPKIEAGLVALGITLYPGIPRRSVSDVSRAKGAFLAGPDGPQ
jgi:hypothetical protein